MRTDARIFAFKYIFVDLFNANANLQEKIDDLKLEMPLNEKDFAFAEELFDAYEKNKDALKSDVQKVLEGYDIDRVFKADLALIFTAVTEIKFLQTPKPIVVDEILEIAKKYSTDKSSSFINGILAKIN